MEAIRVSARVSPGTYINDAKARLAAKGLVELSALENGINTAIRTADSLVSLGYAVVNKFETSLLENDDNTGRTRGAAKVYIRLDKASTFDKAFKDFESSRAKNN